MTCNHKNCFYGINQKCDECNKWWCGIGCTYCQEGQKHGCRICGEVHRTRDHNKIVKFPLNEKKALKLLNASYNYYSGMNVLNMRDCLFKKKTHYNNQELADMYLAGLAIQSFGLVLKVDNDNIIWKSKNECPDGILSDIMKENIKLLVKLNHPAFISLRPI
jgi:hypothetical protein